jgi:hypothetical protein
VPLSWEEWHRGGSLREPLLLDLNLADPHAFLHQHGGSLGAHARNVRHLSSPVSLLLLTRLLCGGARRYVRGRAACALSNTFGYSSTGADTLG